MDTSQLLVIAAFTFLLAGTVKGVVGLGLPTIAVSILSNILPLPVAIGLIVVPAVVTNIWQAVDGGQLWVLLKRLWLFLLMNALFAWLAYRFVLSRYPTEMTVLLGVLLCIYALNGFGLRLPKISTRNATLSATVCGAINGFCWHHG